MKDFDPHQFGPGVKQSDVTPCCVCKKGVMHDKQIMCTRVRVTRMFANLRAIQRQAGLEMMLGSPAIARVMGEDADLLLATHKEETKLICDACAISTGLHLLWEESPERDTTAPG